MLPQTGLLTEITYKCHSMNAVADFDGNNTYLYSVDPVRSQSENIMENETRKFRIYKI